MEWIVFPVRDTANLADLFLHAVKTYENCDAYATAQARYTYRQVWEDVSRCAAWLDTRGRQITSLQEADPYCFAVGFFAAMLLGRCMELEMPRPDGQLWVNQAMAHPEKLDLQALPPPDPDACAVVVFSSGTTHARKEVMLSQRNLASNTVAGLQRLQYAPGHRFLHLVPFSHVFGLVCELLAAFYSGCCVCFGGPPVTFFQNIKRFSPQYLNLPPAMVEGMLQLLDRFGTEAVTGGCVRRILCGGAHVSRQVVQRMAEYGITVLSCYGLSEAPGVCLNAERGNRPDTVGRPIACDTLRIGPGGEIWISGSNVMLGYRNRQTQPFVIQDGKRWLRTGDAGQLDADGFLQVFGRMDHLMVFSDGKKIAPERFESRMRSIPGVERCRVFQGENGGITVRVMAAAEADPEALTAQLRAVTVDGHHAADIRFVSHIPVTATGKVVRYETENLGTDPA